MPEDQRFPEFGQCVHKVAFHPDRPQRLFAQNHFGVYRSEDRGNSWTAIETGLPSNFGFALVAHPHQPETLYSFPLQADAERFPPGGEAARLPDRERRRSWEPLSRPARRIRTTAQSFGTRWSPTWGTRRVVYFGTRLGEVYASRDEGDTGR